MTTPAVILVEPQLGENIGMVARAMANFGLSELRLISPRDGWPNEAALANASGASGILEAARLYPSLREAIADRQIVLATSARDRGMSKPVMGPEEGAARLRRAEGEGVATAILFGPERTGLSSDDLSLADLLVTFPVSPDHPSLNLAQAVLLLAYEWRKAAVPGPRFTASTRSPPATHEEIGHFFDHLEGALDRAEFFRPLEKRPSMVRNLRNILLRIERLSRQDVRTLRGVITALESGPGRRRRNSEAANVSEPAD